MEIIYYIVMGIVQGIAEFLPISSSGHLALASSFFNFTADEAPAFDVLLHIGTLLAVFVVYRKDIFPLIPAFFSMMKKVFQKKFKLSFYDTNERMVIYIIIATLPLVLIALTGIEDKIELLKNYPMAIGGILIFNGIVLMVSDRLSNGSTNGENAKPKNAIIVGACHPSQAVTNIPASLFSQSFPFAMVNISSGSSPRSAKSLITVFALIINIAAGIPLPDTSATKKAMAPSLSI